PPPGAAARYGTPIRGAAVLHPSSAVSPAAVVAPSSRVAPAPKSASNVAPSALAPLVSAPPPRAPISELRPASVLSPSSALAAAPSALAPVVVPAVPSVEEPPPGELVPVSLLGFVLARLGLAPSPAAPAGEALRLVISDEAYVRAGVALAAVGMRSEAAFRRVQGRRSPTPLGARDGSFFRLVGPGEVWVAGAPGRWQAVSLEDDILYVREDRVLAFDGGVSWEAGAIPGDGLPMLQFRGRGCVVLRLDAPPAAVKVTEDAPANVARARLLGWVGRVVTHKQRTNGPSPFDLTCQGEGVVLFDSMDTASEPERGRASPAGANAGGRGDPPRVPV
ncbi:MAG: hypothetical protein JWM82_222, partial [Myxococcales bacterium]|nr:hypothetical protein [Myxococcales bacterium]